ncbi:MAG: hypothetical protein KUG77_20750 [Nannocystaceae bacterium]|nr:hypothetical protein [Nannocystaceae bacterium]
MPQLRHLAVLALPLLGCQEPREENPFDGSGASASSGPQSSGEAATAASATASSTSGGLTSGSPESSGDSGDEIKLDVGAGSDVFVPGCLPGDADCGCSAVDILFVIDNSGSMGDYQEALGLAFPAFASTLSKILPPGTNVHVGVTSTEMEYSSQGNSTSTNGVCTFVGDGDQSNEAFYVPPDVLNTGRNGAQGRLYDPGGGQPYFSFDSDGDISGAQAWFASAANIGEGGSNIEMLTAPVGWAFDPVNGATNEGFLRDEGAVLVLFFMQDEADQSPQMIDGTPTGSWALTRVAEAKAGCGGLSCVVAGGLLEEAACMGDRPISEFLAGFDAPALGQLPGPFGGGTPQELADEMNELLSNSLADLIGQTCEEITPEG